MIIDGIRNFLWCQRFIHVYDVFKPLVFHIRNLYLIYTSVIYLFPNNSRKILSRYLYICLLLYCLFPHNQPLLLNL